MANFGNTVVLAAIERIQKLFNVSTDTATAELCGVSKQTFSKWKSRGTIDLAKIREALPYLSIDWLLSGEGEILLDSQNISTTDPIKRVQENTARYINKSLQRPTIGTRKKPVEAEGDSIGSEEASAIPIYYSVSAGHPAEAFNELKGFFKFDYLVNERTIGLDMNTDEYSAYGIDIGDVVIVDTARMPEDGNIVLVKLEKMLELLQYNDDNKKVIFKKIAPNNSTKKYTIDDIIEIAGVVIAKIHKL